MTTIKCFGHVYEGAVVEVYKTRALVTWSNGKHTYRRKVRVVHTQADLDACDRRCVLLPLAEMPATSADGSAPSLVAHHWQAGDTVQLRPHHSLLQLPLTVVENLGRGHLRVRNRHGSTFVVGGHELQGVLPERED